MTTEPKLMTPEQLEEIAARDADFAEDLPPPHRMNSHTGGIVVHDRRDLLSHVAALEARVAEMEGGSGRPMRVTVDPASLYVTHIFDGEEVVRGGEDGQAYVATFSSFAVAKQFIDMAIEHRIVVTGVRALPAPPTQTTEPKKAQSPDWVPWKPGDALPPPGWYWTQNVRGANQACEVYSWRAESNKNVTEDWAWYDIIAYWPIPLPAPYQPADAEPKERA